VWTGTVWVVVWACPVWVAGTVRAVVGASTVGVGAGLVWVQAGTVRAAVGTSTVGAQAGTVWAAVGAMRNQRLSRGRPYLGPSEQNRCEEWGISRGRREGGH
jgi:hypothetical protein